MARAACERLRGAVDGGVITVDGCGCRDLELDVSEAGHPLPDGPRLDRDRSDRRKDEVGRRRWHLVSSEWRSIESSSQAKTAAQFGG